MSLQYELPVAGLGPDPTRLTLSPSGEYVGAVKSQNGQLTFDLGTDHVYLLTDPRGGLARPPMAALADFDSRSAVSISGTAVGDTDCCVLWVLEYGRRKRLCHHTVRLSPGYFELSFRPRRRQRSLRLALRLTGAGSLRLEDVTFSMKDKSLLRRQRRVSLSQRMAGWVSPRWEFGAKLLSDCLYDWRRYRDHSGTLNPELRQRALQSQIMISSHGIEKGLSFSNRRPGFGRTYVARLVAGLEQHIASFGFDQVGAAAVNNLELYVEFNRQAGHEDRDLAGKVAEFRAECPPELGTYRAGGTVTVTRESIQRDAAIDFGRFIDARHSIRTFTDRPVSDELISRAVAMALGTPSVCNRQGWKVHIYRGLRKARLLNLQGGNRGFGHNVGTAALLSGDLSVFYRVRERNQVFIDMGLFSMSFVLALHSLGLGTCPLAMAVDHETEETIKGVAGLPESERLIMMLAIGHLPDELRVAESPRRPVTDILTIHGDP